MKFIFIVLAVFLVSSCTYIPVSAKNQNYADECEMTTKKLSIKKISRGKSCFNNLKPKDLIDCLVLSGLIEPASAVVSGSIVLVGNTIHWMEYQATC